MNWLLLVYNAVVVHPIRRVYMYAPDMNGVFGGWGGKENYQICSHMTDTSEQIWQNNDMVCRDLIERRFTSILVVCETILYAYCIWKMVSFLVSYLLYHRPYLQAIETRIDRLLRIVENKSTDS